MPRDYEKDPFEFYETKPWMTRALLLALPEIVRSDVIEPCAGNGAISNVLRMERRNGTARVIEWDIQPRFTDVKTVDATQPEPWADLELAPGAWCVTNPAFSIATKILQLALVRGLNVALLLRVTYGEPCKDREDLVGRSLPYLQLLTGEPDSGRGPDVRIVLPRTKFKGNGSDQATVSWMVYRNRQHASVLEYRVKRSQIPALSEPFPEWLWRRREGESERMLA